MTEGRIHSIESMGLLDGPGIRIVVFFQGCNLRCAYCHNPDTWTNDGDIFSSKELLSKILRFKPYFDNTQGGVTFSGGEPLLQDEFLLEMLKLCKDNDINTAIDTAGYGCGDSEAYKEILKYTDLVILDIKQVDDVSYKSLTGKSMKGFRDFTKELALSNARVWIRHVVVPGITDSKENIKKLVPIISGLKNLDKIELLPYHTLGIDKYKSLGIPYKLEGVSPMDIEITKNLEKYLIEELSTGC